MPSRAYSVTTLIFPGQSFTYYVDAPTSEKGRRKARWQAISNAWDAGFELKFGDVKVRSLGMQETPREVAQKECDAFNALHRPGEQVKCYPLIPPSFEDESKVRMLTIREPGAYVISAYLNSGYAVVATSGGPWAIEAVLASSDEPPRY